MSQPHDSWKKQKLKANSTTQRNSSKLEKCIWNRRRALARVGSKVWIIIIAYRLKWQEESKVKFLTGIKSSLLKASEHHLRLRKEYKLWNTDATSSKYLYWRGMLSEDQRAFPLLRLLQWNHICRIFVLIVLALFKKTVVNKWKIKLCNF